MKHKKLFIVLGVVAVLLILSAIGNSWDRSKPSAGTSAPPAPTPTESGTPAPDPVPSAPENSAVPAPTETPDQSAEVTPAVTDEPEETGEAVTVKYGELLELNDNREARGVVVVKAKITPNMTNALTVSQNYHNAVDLIENQGFADCELQYWAVADMSDGSESKVISFTVPQDVVAQVAAGDVVATTLPDLVTDLWILPSLQN